MDFNPFNWYWQASDSRIYSSASQAAVASDDAAFLAWKGAGNSPTPWPRDDAGNETNAALQAVLNDYGLFADLTAYAADRRWRKEVGGTAINGVTYPTDRETQGKLASAFLLATADPTATFKWKLPDGTFTPNIDATAMQAVAKAVGQYVNGCFLAEESIVAQINAGAITTREQVDAAFAA